MKRVDIGHGITVSFPATPKFSRSRHDPSARLWIVVSNGSEFTVQTSEDDGEGGASDIVKAFVEGSAEGLGARTYNKNLVLVNGWRGLSVELRSPRYVAWERVFRVKNQTIALQYIATSGPLPGAAKTFLDSLLVPSSMAGPFHSPAKAIRGAS